MTMFGVISMNNLDKFKGGFAISGKEPWETVEWLLDKENSTEEKLLFQAYDANMWPLPNISKWPESDHKQKQINRALEIFNNVDGEVWLDDIKIKGGK